jgi:hypothetical protein
MRNTRNAVNQIFRMISLSTSRPFPRHIARWPIQKDPAADFFEYAAQLHRTPRRSLTEAARLGGGRVSKWEPGSAEELAMRKAGGPLFGLDSCLGRLR